MSIRTRLATWVLGLGQPENVKRLASQTITASFDTVTASDWYARNGYTLGASGYTAHTGRTVNQERAMELPAFYAGVKMISEDMGSLPRHVYRYSDDWLATNKARDLRLYRIMHDLVNPEISAGEFVEALTAHAILAGRGLAEIQRQTTSLRKREIVRLWPWMPSDVTLDRDGKGNRIYVHAEGNGPGKTYQREDVFHLKGFSVTGYDGDDLVKRACHALGLGLGTQEFAGRYMQNGIHSDLFFTLTAAKPGPEAVKNIKEAFHESRGIDFAGDPHVLHSGLTDVKRLPMDMEKLQMVEQRRFSVLDVCRVLRIPPHKLAELDRAIQSNIVEQSIDYVVYTLIPWNRRWREAFYRCLLDESERIDGRLYMEHDFAGLLRGDFTKQAEGFRTLLEKGVYSINEVRRLLNMNPVPGGDDHYIQLNMQAVGEAAAEASGSLTPERTARLLKASPDELEALRGLYQLKKG